MNVEVHITVVLQANFIYKKTMKDYGPEKKDYSLFKDYGF